VRHWVTGIARCFKKTSKKKGETRSSSIQDACALKKYNSLTDKRATRVSILQVHFKNRDQETGATMNYLTIKTPKQNVVI
jgi:hypothetical protein